MNRLLLAAVIGGMLIIGGTHTALAEEDVAEPALYTRAQPLLIDPEIIPKVRPEQHGFLGYLRERTHFGVGFTEEYNSNIFLNRDNNPREDYISTLEGDIFFADPKGALLYGFEHEINAFRYHKLNANAVNHDFSSFVDLDPGGRAQWGATYHMNAHNALHQDPIESDLVRSSGDFQRSVEHAWTARMKYALNETNYCVPQLTYSLYDDQTVNDADTDRRSFGAILDWDHTLAPTWVLFGGYQFDKTDVPGNKLRNSDVHSVRLGTRHALSQISDLEATFKIGRRKGKTGQQATEFGFDGKWKCALGPRTSLLLSYTDQEGTSFVAGRSRFRSSVPSMKLTYTLSPLTELHLDGLYSRQTSSTRDVLPGSAATATKSNLYQFSSGILWRAREKTKVTLDYKLSRSKTGDYTDQSVLFTIEVGL